MINTDKSTFSIEIAGAMQPVLCEAPVCSKALYLSLLCAIAAQLRCVYEKIPVRHVHDGMIVCKRKLTRQNRNSLRNTSHHHTMQHILDWHLSLSHQRNGQKVVHFMAASVSLSIKNDRNGFFFIGTFLRSNE